MSFPTSLRAAFQRVYHVPGVPAAAFLAGLLFLFQPALIYEGNEPYFYFGLAQLSIVLLPMFLAAFALLAGLAAIGGPRLRGASAALLAGFAVAAWAGAVFFEASKGLVDGRTMLQLANLAEVRSNSIWYAAIAAGGAAVGYLLPHVTRQLFCAMFVVLFAHATWIACADAKPWRGSPAVERLVTLSAERNVLVVLLDAFQSDFFAEIVQ